MVETTELESVTSCVWRNGNKSAQEVAAAESPALQRFQLGQNTEAVQIFRSYSLKKPDTRYSLIQDNTS